MKNKSPLILSIITVLINVLYILFLVLFVVFNYVQPYKALFITFLMCVFHADFRIMLSTIVRLFKNKINIDKKLYSINEKEFKRLEKIKIKKRKDKFPVLFKYEFEINDLSNYESIKEVVQNNINAEISHWLCFFLCLFGIGLGLMFSLDEWWIYLLTSLICSFVIDLPPILIQRYNRYRLQKIVNIIKK